MFYQMNKFLLRDTIRTKCVVKFELLTVTVIIIVMHDQLVLFKPEA